MSGSTLEELAALDADGRLFFRVGAAAGGDLVLCHPAGPLAQGVRELGVPERVRLAEVGAQRPALVAESDGGDYVVLIDDDIDPERHVPLAPADAELLVGGAARARFGRRDDDVLTLTAWADEDDVVVVDLDGPGFEAMPVVSREADGTLTWHRGELGQDMAVFVRDELDRRGADPGERFGVLTNPFGEFLCVADRTPLPPHEDIRRQTLMGTAALLEGVGSLSGAAARLRSVADQLGAAEKAGWQLVQPVTHGLAFLEVSTERR